MRTKKKICIIGHFGFGKECSDGQTIKTKIVSEELEKRYGEDEVTKIDTEGGRRRLLLYPLLMWKALRDHANVIILPAHNGLRVIAPLLALENRIFRKRLHYVVIGGWLPEFLKKHKRLTKHIKAFHGVYVETSTMKSALEEQGFTNVFVMPNCKKLTILRESELVYSTSEPFRLCTFSRVMKEKGIEDAVNAVKEINERFGRTVYTLDIYGQVDAGQTEWFSGLQGSFPDCIRYGGIVPYDKSVDVLKNYYALLFPTHYAGEGFAGTLVDALASGVPVIASDWKYNSEIISKSTGGCYPTHNFVKFCKLLVYACTHKDEWNGKKVNCLKQAHKYDVSNAITMLTDNIR